MITVGSIMTAVGEYPTIPDTESVAAAFEGLKEFSVSPWVGNKTIVVVDAGGNAVGLLTIKSLLRAIDLEDPSMEMELREESWANYFTWHKKKWADLPVSQVMRPLSGGIGADTPLLKAAQKFIEQDVNTMPVFENGGKVTGLVNVYHLCRFFEKHL